MSCVYWVSLQLESDVDLDAINDNFAVALHVECCLPIHLTLLSDNEFQLTLATLKYCCINHRDPMGFFQFEIIINVLVSSFI